MTADGNHAAGVAIGAASNSFVDAHRTGRLCVLASSMVRKSAKALARGHGRDAHGYGPELTREDGSGGTGSGIPRLGKQKDKGSIPASICSRASRCSCASE